MTAAAIRLSIAMPTYNGDKTLREVLSRIIPQLVPGVEIVISDNASTDDTPEIVRESQSRCAAVRYFRNDSNLGFDRNVDLCVRRSRGEFVWLFADDDIMHDRAIEAVLSIVSRNPDVFTIYVDSLKPHTSLISDLPHVKMDEFFTITRFRSGGMSANIVRRSIWEGTDLSPYYGSGFIHVAFLVAAAASADRNAYIYRGSLKDELDLSKRLDVRHYFESGLRLAEIFRSMRMLGYRSQTVRQGLLTVRGTYWRDVPLLYKPNGLRPSAMQIWRAIRAFKGFPLFWLVDLPLLLAPAFCFQALMKVYRVPKIQTAYRRLKSAIRGAATERSEARCGN